MNKITTIGLDLAKNVFHVVCCDKRGKIIQKKKLRRSQLLNYFVNFPACVVAMEACSSAHYWARELKSQGHKVRLISPQHVKPFVRGNKNDYNDALAIAEAATRGEMRFVAPKSIEQQDLQALYRLREGSLKEQTALSNRIRGLLSEYGLVIPKTKGALRRHLPALLEDAENGLSENFRTLLAQAYEQLRQLDEHVDSYTRQMKHYSLENEACRRLESIPGYGPVVACVFYSMIGNGEAFRRGRDVSASLGLVPKQHSTGGKQVLLGISKRGDRYLRSLLVHGARAVVSRAKNKDDHLSRWINKIRVQRGFNKAAVALANKMARIGWALLANQSVYQAR